MSMLTNNVFLNSSVNKSAFSLSKKTILTASMVGFCGLASAQSFPTPEITLEQVQSIANSAATPGKLTVEQDLRAKALREAAQSYGARAGFLQKSGKIRDILEQHSTLWDAAWNFNSLLLVDEQRGEKGAEMRPRIIVPPVLLRSEDNTYQVSANVFQTTDETYRIHEQVHFSSVAPNWRTYLIRDTRGQALSPPHSSLLPKDDAEREKFKQWVAEGWESGVKQAWDVYITDVKKLDRDYGGMTLYHELVEQRKVSLPFVASSNKPISGDDNTMNINDVTLKITVMPSFQRDSKQWTPLER
jgi:defect-in-organelle-trafficking protein DotC